MLLGMLDDLIQMLLRRGGFAFTAFEHTLGPRDEFNCNPVDFKSFVIEIVLYPACPFVFLVCKLFQRPCRKYTHGRRAGAGKKRPGISLTYPRG